MSHEYVSNRPVWSPVFPPRLQLHSSAHHCQHLPSSLLIENASDQFVAPSAPCPAAFQIKANNLADKWLLLIVGQLNSETARQIPVGVIE